MTVEVEWDSFLWEDVGDYGAGEALDRGNWHVERVEDGETVCAAEGVLVRIDAELVLIQAGHPKETLEPGFYGVFDGDLGQKQLIGPVSEAQARRALGDYTCEQYEQGKP